MGGQQDLLPVPSMTRINEMDEKAEQELNPSRRDRSNGLEALV
jgi:hypothetical protein